jgi:hypothetical protein
MRSVSEVGGMPKLGFEWIITEKMRLPKSHSRREGIALPRMPILSIIVASLVRFAGRRLTRKPYAQLEATVRHITER